MSDVAYAALKEAKRLRGLSMAGDTMIIEGDSKAANNNVSNHLSDRGAVTWANIFMRQSFKIVANNAVGGQRSDEIRKRIGKLTAAKPAWAYIDSGTNNISQSKKALDTFNDNVYMYEECLNNGIRVIVPTLPPSASWTTPEQIKAYFELNELLIEYAARTPGIYLVDIGNVLMGTEGTAIVNAVDSTHPSAKGACMQGRIIANEMMKHIPMRASTMRLSKGDPFNLTGNGGMVGSSGTAAGTAKGTVADGWIVSGSGTGTVTVSKVPRNDGLPGEMLQIEMVGGDATSSVDFYKDIMNIPTGGTAAVYQDNDLVYHEIEVEYDAAAVITQGITFGALCRVNSTGKVLSTNNGLHHESSNPDLGMVPQGTMLIRTQNFNVSAGTDRMRPLLKTYLSSGKFWIKRAQVRKENSLSFSK